ncbi:hypothetical protein [Streptomyces sp. HYC2]|nr:hypothetical protein [Streptomyces sp. HYC2]
MGGVGAQTGIDTHRLPWSASRLGARSEYRFAAPPPRRPAAPAPR